MTTERQCWTATKSEIITRDGAPAVGDIVTRHVGFRFIQVGTVIDVGRRVAVRFDNGKIYYLRMAK